MFEISELKDKKLPELQEIAKELNVPKYRTQKKMDLVYQILDYQAANPKAVKNVIKAEVTSSEEKKAEPAKTETPKASPQENQKKEQKQRSQRPDNRPGKPKH